MSHPRFQRARAFRRVPLTSGDITLNATALTAVSGSLDMSLEAQVGDQIEYGISGLLENIGQSVGLDVYTFVSSAKVTPFGAGLSASLASTQGVPGWFGTTDATLQTLTGSVIGPALVAGDITAAGQVVLTLWYAKATATARKVYANANVPLTVWAKNLGPPDPE